MKGKVNVTQFHLNMVILGAGSGGLPIWGQDQGSLCGGVRSGGKCDALNPIITWTLLPPVIAPHPLSLTL